MPTQMSPKIPPTSSVFNIETKTWTGPKKDIIFGPDVSIGRSILESLSKHPEHISQICANNGNEYTNKDIATMSICVAQHLEDLGIEQEDIVGICASNTDFLAPLVFGSLLCGATVNALDSSLNKDGLRHTFALTKTKFMFCDGKIYQIVKDSLTEIAPSCQIFTMKDHLEGVRRIDELIVSTGKEGLFAVKPLKRGSEQTAVIVCTSGTTGLPKEVCISHEYLVNAFTYSLNESDKLFCVSMINWLSGLRGLIHGTLFGCTRVITDQKYSPELFLRIIEQHEINIVFSAAAHLVAAVRCPYFKKRNLSSLEAYICGGSAVPLTVVEEFTQHIKGCQLISRYGMSELCGGCSFGKPTKPGANGKLRANITIKIIDDGGQKLGIGETGQICINYPSPWAGYYGDPEATSEVYDQDRFIHSGDLGYFDENGTLLIVGRKKDIIKYKNFNVFPSEIEEVIMEISDVGDVCVCGLSDVGSNFLPAAAVIKAPNSNLTEVDITKYVSERMAHFNHLRGGVFFMDTFPKTPSRKNIRPKITKIVESLREERHILSSKRNNVDMFV